MSSNHLHDVRYRVNISGGYYEIINVLYWSVGIIKLKRKYDE